MHWLLCILIKKVLLNFMEYIFYEDHLIIELNREKYIIRENIIVAIIFQVFFFYCKTVFLVIINEKVIYL